MRRTSRSPARSSASGGPRGQTVQERRDLPDAGRATTTDSDVLDTLSRRQMQQDLVTRHVRLARALAHRFLHRGKPTDKLEQVALLALVKASHRFDAGHNATFATYATVSIVGELKRHFRDKTWMLRVPRSTQELYLSVEEAREELGHQLGTPPTVAQIAVHLGVGEEAILEAIKERGKTVGRRRLTFAGRTANGLSTSPSPTGASTRS